MGDRVMVRGLIEKRPPTSAGGTRSTRTQHLGWSTNQAADFAGMPSRTVHAWRTTGFLEPVIVPTRRLGIDEPRYGLCDVVALRMAQDLLDARVERSLVQAVVAEVCGFQEVDGKQVEGSLDFRNLATMQAWIMFPASKEIAAMEVEVLRELELPPRESLTTWTWDDEMALTEGVPDIPGGDLVRWIDIEGTRMGCLYPVSVATREVLKVIDRWREHEGYALHGTSGRKRQVAAWM